MKKIIAACIVAAIVLVPALADDTAPRAGSFGITASAASDSYIIGGVYHFTKFFALRPFVGFDNGYDSLSDFDDSDKGYFEWTVGGDALYELYLGEGFLLGLGGTVSFSRYSDADQNNGSGVTNDRTTLRAGALARAQYFFSRRFAVYSDFGIGMSRMTNVYDNGTDAPSNYNRTKTSWRTTAFSLGLAYYFK